MGFKIISMRFFDSFIVILILTSCSNTEVPISDDSKHFETLKKVKSLSKPSEELPNKTQSTSSTFNNKTTKKLKPEVETDIEISDFLNPYNNPNYKDDSTNQVVTNNVVQTVNGKLVFKTSIIDSGDPRIGCSASSKSLNFELVNNKQDYFELKDSELKTVNFSYIINGGLLYQIGNEPMRGTIKGQKLNGEWIIEINIYIEMQDVNFPESKPIENHLVYKGIYK